MNYILIIIGFIVTCGIAGTVGYVIGHEAGENLGISGKGEELDNTVAYFKNSINERTKQLKTLVKFWDDANLYRVWSDLEEYAEKRIHNQFRYIELSADIKESNEYLLSVINNYTSKTEFLEEEYLEDLINTYSRSETRSKYLMHYVIHDGANWVVQDDYSPLAELSKLIKIQSRQFEIGLLFYSTQQQITSVAESLEKLIS